jgi:hypothetical protein
MRPNPIDLTELTVEYLGKTVSVQQQSDPNKGYVLGRLVEIRHRFAADSATPETRVKVEIFEEPGVVVAVTLGPDRRLQR